MRPSSSRLQSAACIALLGACLTCAAHAQGAPPMTQPAIDVRQQLAALLPAARIDDSDLLRALDPPRGTVCRQVAVQWSGPGERTAAATDGRLTLVAAARCREPYDVRASARIGGDGLLVVAVDGGGAMLWWQQIPDIRLVHPSLMPTTGEAQVDRENARLHRVGLRAGAAMFGIEFPADRRIARLIVYESRRDTGARTPISLGSVEVPKP